MIAIQYIIHLVSVKRKLSTLMVWAIILFDGISISGITMDRVTCNYL